jgi:MoxR-like ATPase
VPSTSIARSSSSPSRSSTRRALPARHGLAELERLIEYGASPRASISLMRAAQALALLRGRMHATTADVRDLAADVLRHRLVLSYDALADDITPDAPIDRVLATVGGLAAVPEAA